MAFFGSDRLTVPASQVHKVMASFGNVLKAKAYRYLEFR